MKGHTGQHPRRRETDEQAEQREIRALARATDWLRDAVPVKGGVPPMRISASGKLVR